jgi:hypothetical protein
MEQRLLEIYLNDHLAAATGGVELLRRLAAEHTGARGEELARLVDEVTDDRESWRELMGRLEAEETPVKTAAGWLGEKVGRLKPNGHLISRSPLADVLELEVLRAGTTARIAGLQVLRAVAVEDDRVGREELERLLERAQGQAERFYRLHVQLAHEELAG